MEFKHEFGQGPLSVVLLHVGTVQRNALSNLVGGDVGGALSVGGACLGQSTSFFFQLKPGVDIVSKEPGLRYRKIPNFVNM